MVYTIGEVLISNTLNGKVSGINNFGAESTEFQSEKHRARHKAALLCFLLSIIHGVSSVFLAEKAW